MILIVGASGNLGSAVAHQLLEQGRPVRGMTRTPEKLKELEKAGLEVIQADLRDPDSLRMACEGVEKVLAAAHAFIGKGDNASEYVDGEGNRALIDAARQGGAKHLVFVSARGVRADHPVDFMRTKYAIEEYLKASGLSYSILRASAFMETWAALVGDPIALEGKANIFGTGNNPINYIAVDDVARFAIHALEESSLQNQTLEVGGADNVSMRELVALFEEVLGIEAKKSRVPLPMMRIMRVLVRPFNPVLSRMITAGIDNETADQTFDPTNLLVRFPGGLTRLEDFARARYA